MPCMSKTIDVNIIKAARDNYEQRDDANMRKESYERGLLKGYHSALEDILILLERDDRAGMLYPELWLDE